MLFNRRLFRNFSLIASLGLGAAAVAQTQANSSHVVLQLPESARFEFAGYYAAQAQGYFKAEGLAVENRSIFKGQNRIHASIASRARC